VPIADDQRCRLGEGGHRLGVDTWLGSEIDDVSNRVRITFSDVPQALFRQLLPGAPGHAQLVFLIRYYLIDPFDVDVEIALRHEDASGARFGHGSWSRLGVDSWLAPEQADLPTKVCFRL